MAEHMPSGTYRLPPLSEYTVTEVFVPRTMFKTLDEAVKYFDAEYKKIAAEIAAGNDNIGWHPSNRFDRENAKWFVVPYLRVLWDNYPERANFNEDQIYDYAMLESEATAHAWFKYYHKEN